MTAISPTTPSSNAPVSAVAPQARLIVLEGMPGAGKTTHALALASAGAQVLGEYASRDGTILPIADHPALDDDTGHQLNWLHKAVLTGRALADGAPVYADRDWLSSLAYAYSIAGQDNGAMLCCRAHWALICLAAGTLLLPGTYVIFQVDVATSLRRRAGRLRDGHPWSQPAPLRRLQHFYADPACAVAAACPPLAVTLGRTHWRYVSGHGDPEETVPLLRHLGAVERG